MASPLSAGHPGRAKREPGSITTARNYGSPPSRGRQRSFASPLSHRLGQIVAEVLEYAREGIGRSLPESADRGVAHRGGQLVQQRLIPWPGCHQLDGLFGSGAAGRALAAAFVLEEAHQVERYRFHVVLV